MEPLLGLSSPVLFAASSVTVIGLEFRPSPNGSMIPYYPDGAPMPNILLRGGAFEFPWEDGAPFPDQDKKCGAIREHKLTNVACEGYSTCK